MRKCKLFTKQNTFESEFNALQEKYEILDVKDLSKTGGSYCRILVWYADRAKVCECPVNPTQRPLIGTKRGPGRPRKG